MAVDQPSPGLRRNRNWRLFFCGQAISLLGDNIFDVTIVLWIATIIARNQTWAPLAVGGALIAVAAPVMLVGPFAGVFVDRWDRRRTMMVADLVRAALIAGLLILPVVADRMSVAAQLTCVYAVVALASATAQFFNGARFGLLAGILAPSDQPRAGGINQTIVALAGIVGPPLAAPLLFSVGVSWALVANALSFVVSFLLVLSMRVPSREQPLAEAKPDFRRELVEGARFFGRSRVLRSLMISVVVATLGVGAINALDVFFITDNLHAPAGALGTLGAAFGIGSVVGALAATAISGRIRATLLFWTMLTLTGVAIMAYSRADTLAIGFVILLLAGVPISIVNSVAGPILMRATPQHLLGRVMAVFNPIQQVAAIGGMAVVTYLASTSLRGLDIRVAGVHFGRIDVIFFLAGVLVVAAGVWVGFPLRAIEKEPFARGVEAIPVPEPAAAPDAVDVAEVATQPDDDEPRSHQSSASR